MSYDLEILSETSYQNFLNQLNNNLISSDTASLVPHERYAGTDTLAITLIFKKNN